MKIKVKIIVLFFITAVITNMASAQSLPDSTTKKIDSIFIKWNTNTSPGGTIGIVRNDSLIYSKGYGMANLEYAVHNTPATIFHMASISKQFTAFSIVLLAKQGKLKLDDDIHKYLPWFPDLKAKITIRHLLNHTSGIRDQWQLLAISGTRLDDVITQDHIIKILSKQRALNFKPGEKYSYSNSGFTLLAEIVKSVTGHSLRKFTDSAIFKPLGMKDTHFHDDYTEIVWNRSYSYNRVDSVHFSNSILSYSNAGATSLFTNINDMSKWVMNFYNHKVGDQTDIDQLTKKGKLNNGKDLTYALGIAVGTFNGWKEYSHGGADAGYRTYLSVLPDNKMGFIVFGNLNDFNPGGKMSAIGDLFLKDTSQVIAPAKTVKRDSASAILKDSLKWKKFLGDYTSDDGVPFNIYLKAGALYYRVYDETNFLIKDTRDSFSVGQDASVKFVFALKNKDTLLTVITPDQNYYCKKYRNDVAPDDLVLKKYTGTYYCPELDCKYGIELKNHQLILTNSKYNDTKLSLIGTDHLLSDYWWMNHLKVLYDSSQKVKGFEVNAGRIEHLKFNKISR